MFVLCVILALLARYSEETMSLRHEYAVLKDEGRCNDLYNVTFFSFHKYNRTTKAVSANLTLFQDITERNDVEIKLSLYTWKNYDFKKTPINWSMKACFVLDKGTYALKKLLAQSTVTKCPVKKGAHYLKDVSTPDLEGWPSVIPDGKWKLRVEYWHKNRFCSAMEWTAGVTRTDF